MFDTFLHFKKIHGYFEVFKYEKLLFFTKTRHDFSRKKKHRWDFKLFVLSISQATWKRTPWVQARWAVFLFLPMSSLCRLGKKVKIEVFSAGGGGGAFFFNFYNLKNH